MSQTVSTSSRRSRSGDCTRAAKVSMVLGSMQVALEGGAGHGEVIAHQPGHGFGLGGRSGRGAGRTASRHRRPAPNDRRRGPWRCRAAAPRDRARAATGPCAPSRPTADGLPSEIAGLDTREDADGADGVLVDGVRVVHVVLRLRDDATEVRDELAEDAGLVETAQASSPDRCATSSSP